MPLRLVAMDRVVVDLSCVVGSGDSDSARVFSQSHHARIRLRSGPVCVFEEDRRTGAPSAADVFLHFAPAAQVRALESADDRSFDCRSSFAKMEVARGSPANGARNLVVSVLEPRRFDRDVARSGKTRGPNLSRDSTVVPAARGSNRERLGE